MYTGRRIYNLNSKENMRNLSSGLNELYFRDGQLFYLYISEKALENIENAEILASIHGYSGRKNDPSGKNRVKLTALLWAKLADQNGWVVLSPHFDEKRFSNNYQRLNLHGKNRSDQRLHELVNEIERFLPGIKTEKLLLFGFSGGGQFVHRYALFQPERVKRAVAGGAGWYVFPDDKLPYPIGISPQSLPKSVQPKLNDLLNTKLLILVGENDGNEGAFKKTYVNNFRTYNLLALQGDGRRERAENWVASLQKVSGDKKINIRLKIVPLKGRHNG